MFERKEKYQIIVQLGVILSASLGLGALIQAILPRGNFWLGLMSIAGVLFAVIIALFFTWKKAGAGKMLAWMMFLAFFLRVAFGVFLAWGLPRFGYEEDVQQAGYVFEDAYRRDRDAWALARSDQPLLGAFSDEYEVDQYGGLLALSGFIYRYISPDEHRPILIVLLAAGAMALSVLFLISGLKRKINPRAAIWAGWIMVLYPEGILLAASQMREPFIILMFSAMLWSGTHWAKRSNLKTAVIVFSLSAVSLFLLSFRVAVPIIGVVLLWAWVIKSPDVEKKWVRGAVWAVVGVGVLAVSLNLIEWVKDFLSWDVYVTVLRSGMIQAQLEKLPEWMVFPFILVYGVFQPVLPAAIAAPAPWIWRGLAIFRSMGWYAMLPLLGYASARGWRLEPSQRRRLIRLMAIVVWAWILIASARAGGNQWDNPRYRTIFLPLMAALGAWAVHFAQETKDRWLQRGLLIEVIFLGFFSSWYIGRYYKAIPTINFWFMVGTIIFLSLLIIVGGMICDSKRIKPSFVDKNKD